jgi:hypothetical protein
MNYFIVKITDEFGTQYHVCNGYARVAPHPNGIFNTAQAAEDFIHAKFCYDNLSLTNVVLYNSPEDVPVDPTPMTRVR